MPVLLGLDMGGTSVKAAIVSLEGGLIGSTNKQLNRSTGDTTPAKMVDLLVDCAQDVVSQSDLEWTNVAAIGLCTCAAVKDRDKGIIAGAANLDGDWTDFPLRSETEKKLELIAGCQIRIFLTTDFDAPALAETWIGAAKGHANSVHICIGTGIGVSFLENGHLIRGTNGIIEAGHIIVMPRGRQCGCGSRGCLEAYCAAPGIVEGVLSRMRAAFRDGSIDAGSSQEKALFDYFGLKSGTLPSCKDVFEAANYEPCSQNQIGTDLFRQICKQTVDEVCELLVSNIPTPARNPLKSE